MIDPNALTKSELLTLEVGGFIHIGNHRYAKCHRCRKIVKTNGFFGSLHFCEDALKDRRLISKRKR